MTPISKWMMVLGAGGLIASAPARAADLATPLTSPTPPIETNGWQFSVSPYFWAAGLSGSVAQFGAPTVHVSPNFGDILKNLDFAFMASGEARYGRFSLFADTMYTKLSIGSGTPRGIVANSVSLSSETAAGLIGAGYSILKDERGQLDLVAGVRVWSVSNTVTLNGGVLNGASFNDSAVWADGMVGVRGRYGLTETLFLTGWGMIGKGAAKLDWDVAAGIGYRLNDQISAIIGYRALGVDYRNNGFVFDVVQQGPILGLTARF